MSCYGQPDDDSAKPNGVCPDCGSETEDGYAIDSCGYSPVECETCGWRPCDGSC